MDDVERLFGELVTVLSRTAPQRLTGAIPIGEIYERILPYRLHRRALEMDSIEDYEMALLRLLAGEHGLAETSPPEVAQTLRRTVEAVNPDSGAFRAFPDASVRFDAAAVRALLVGDAAWGPDRNAVLAVPTPEAEPPSGDTCPDCGAELPAGRRVVFCPFCARQFRTARCTRCGDDVEPGWQYCATCGLSVSGGP